MHSKPPNGAPASDLTEPRARYGWESDLPAFSDAQPRRVREALREFVPDASPRQPRAWSDAIPPLQEEVREGVLRDALITRLSDERGASASW